MKKLILLLIGFFAGFILYQTTYNSSVADKQNQQDTEVIEVEGKVTGNLSIMRQSVYELVSITDTTQIYYVIIKGEAPPIDETRSVRLVKEELFVLNDNRVAVYLEQPDNE
jgi:hypothetical protein